MAEPYYQDETTTLWLGDMREVVPTLDIHPDLVLTDPPYGETSLAWDRWPAGWPGVVAEVASSLWCFGSMRMFLDRNDEFANWRLSQDVVWEKHNGSGFANDRFKRVHEHATHWYRGNWRHSYHVVPRVAVPAGTPKVNGVPASHNRAAQLGAIRPRPYDDDGTRLVRSVIRAAPPRNRTHPTEKPVELLRPLIEYGCPSGGLVLDPFAGSGSTAEAARQLGRRAVLVEGDERYCEAIAHRMSQTPLPLEEVRRG